MLAQVQNVPFNAIRFLAPQRRGAYDFFPERALRRAVRGVRECEEGYNQYARISGRAMEGPVFVRKHIERGQGRGRDQERGHDPGVAQEKPASIEPYAHAYAAGKSLVE